jgi:uncharacterized protein YegL
MGWASYNEDIVSRWVGARPSKPSKSGLKRSPISPRVLANGLPPKMSNLSRENTNLNGNQMSKLKEFVVAEPRPLPVIILADVSGSMASDGKLQAMNQAIKEMVLAFADEDDLRAEIHLAVITFGGRSAAIHLPLTTASKVTWQDCQASGGTPLGAALGLVTSVVEDRTQIPARAYRPTIVLVSDGQPTDDWERALETLLSSPRCSKAFRIALAIGADADEQMMKKFLANENAKVFRADEARQIRQFFRFVTMSVTSRRSSANPNDSPQYQTPHLEDIEF